MATEHSAEQLAYFEALDEEKQQRYERRVAEEILSGLGFTRSQVVVMEHVARDETGVEHALTPEWVSHHLSCPVAFMAIKDYRINAQGGFPTPEWLLNHVSFGKFSLAFLKTWEEAKSRFDRYVAVCIRPAWAERTLVMHNYDAVTRYTPGIDKVPAHLMWPRSDGVIIMQYLRDALQVLNANWQR